MEVTVKLRWLCSAAAVATAFGAKAQQQARSLKMQSSWPAGIAAQDHFRIFADRLEKITGGTLKVEVMAAGQIVPAFEVLDAANKKVIDGFHSIPYYWVNKNRAAVLFAGPPEAPSAWTTPITSGGCGRAADTTCGSSSIRRR